jgi:hypothetical protein
MVLYVINEIMFVYINFSFDFLRLSLNNVYFLNYFANELTRSQMVRFLSHLKYSCFITYKTLDLSMDYELSLLMFYHIKHPCSCFK